MSNKPKNASEIDEDFIINSFTKKDKPYRLTEQPLTEIENEDSKVSEQQDNKRRKSKLPDYPETFLFEADISSRDGKQTNIREEHHNKISNIVRTVTKGKVSIFSYIDNVLAHHFATYQDEIEDLYDKNIVKTLFKK